MNEETKTTLRLAYVLGASTFDEVEKVRSYRLLLVQRLENEGIPTGGPLWSEIIDAFGRGCDDGGLEAEWVAENVNV